MTPEDIDALPNDLRRYIRDPAGEMRAWKAGEDAVLALALENKRLKERVTELEEEKADIIRNHDIWGWD